MKKSLLIIPAIALLAACGGSQNQNNGTTTDTTDNGGDGRPSVSTTTETDADIPFSMENVLTALGGDINSSSHDFVEDENLAYFQRGENVYTEHFVKAYPIADNAYHIVETFTRVEGLNEADYEGETHYIKEYIYKNGKATEVELQAELKPFATKYATDFSKDILKILNGTETVKEFKWDGTKFVAQQELFAYEILKRIVTDKKEFDRISNGFETEGIMSVADRALTREEWGTLSHLEFIYHEDDMYPESGYLDCFPIKTGGYFALFRTLSEGDYEHWTYTPYIYKNGVLSDGKSMLPVPGINDYYANAAQFPKEAAKVLSSAMEAPEYSFYMNDEDSDNSDANEITLTVRFEAWELDERGGVLPAPLKGFQRKEDRFFPTIDYHWNGEKFARDPKDKPLKEDLQYFEPVPAEWKSAVAYQVAQKLGLNFPNQELENPNQFRMWEDEFDPPLYFVYCFPYTNGGHLALYGEGVHSLQDYKAYVFKDGEVKETDFKFPGCPLSDLLNSEKIQGLDNEIKLLEEIYAKNPTLLVEYLIHTDTQEIEAKYQISHDTDLPNETRDKLWSIGKYNDLPKFKWNGENFVKE